MPPEQVAGPFPGAMLGPPAKGPVAESSARCFVASEALRAFGECGLRCIGSWIEDLLQRSWTTPLGTVPVPWWDQVGIGPCLIRMGLCDFGKKPEQNGNSDLILSCVGEKWFPSQLDTKVRKRVSGMRGCQACLAFMCSGRMCLVPLGRALQEVSDPVVDELDGCHYPLVQTCPAPGRYLDTLRLARRKATVSTTRI